MTTQEKKELLRKLVTEKLRPQNEKEKIEFAASQIHHLIIQRIINQMKEVKMTQSELAKRMNVWKRFYFSALDRRQTYQPQTTCSNYKNFG